MLKLLPTEANKFHNFKCGEIYCITATTYNVACCLCGVKIAFNEFPEHFEQEHLRPSKSEETRKSEDEDPFKVLNTIKVDAYPVKHEFDEEFQDALVPTELVEFIEDEKPIDFDDLPLNNVTSEIQPNVALFGYDDGVEMSDDVDEDDMPLIRRRTRNTTKTGTAAKKKRIVKGNVKKKQALVKDDTIKTSSLDEDEKKEHLDDLKLDEAEIDDDEIEILKDESDFEYLSDKNPEDDDDDAFNPGEKKKPFPCPDCDLSYSSKRGLWGHRKVHHDPNRQPAKPRKKKPKDFKCDECGAEFYTESNLRCHMYKHTGIICDICGKDFSQIGNLMRHKIRHTGIKAHKCTECECTFYTDKELKAHMMRHTGILPCICEVCGKRCRDHGKLKEHMRRHTGERPAKCEVCGKCFFSGHDLNVHLLSHSDHRPYMCNVCGARAKSKKALRVHKKLHSTDRNHECKVCGKGFAQSTGLQSHMRTHDAAALSTNISVESDGDDNTAVLSITRNFLV